VVEDTAEIREVWRRFLTSAGFHVLQAGDGADGVCKAREHQPDLIVMDITLPVLDGISAVLQLKADKATAHIPVIFVSGDAFAARRARAVGGEAFLSKPVRVSELLSVITRTLDEREHAAEWPAERKFAETAAENNALKR
jgi:CheY-like chemotaxis protein